MTNLSNSTGTMPTPNGEPATTQPSGYVEPKAEVKTEPTSEIDEFGYTKEPEAKTEPVADKEPEAKTEPVADKVTTGYGENDPTPEVKTEPKKEDKEDPTDADKLLKFEIKEALGELSENYDVETITNFAEANGLSKDQVKAYVELTKNEDKARSEATIKAKTDQRSGWLKELKEDSTFGGENFSKSVERVESVLENYLPNLKKALTDRAGMLPPYIMRDLLSLSKTLNPTTTLVTGEGLTPPAKEEGNFLDDMYS